MSDEEKLQATKQLMDNISQMAMLLSVEDVRAVVNEINRTETLAPILDPTWYLYQGRDNIPGHKRIAKAFLAFRNELQAVADEENNR